MPATASPEVVFLFEDEVREAARRLAALREMRSRGDDDAFSHAIVSALNVCMAALAGAERDDVCILLTRKAALGVKDDA
jgi:hypothetical protein